MKLPAIQFYPGDWRKDVGVQSLSFHDRGVWFEMLMLMHESPVRGKLMLGGKAVADEVLANVLHIDLEVLKVTISTLIERGVTERETRSGALVNRRMVRDDEGRAKNRKKLNDWRKSKKTQDSCNQDETALKPAPSSSSSSSSSSSELQNPLPPSDGIDPAMMARGLCERLNISRQTGNGSVYMAAYDVAANAQKRGENLEVLCDRMEAAHQVWIRELPNLAITWNVAKFFGDGWWERPEAWPRAGPAKTTDRDAKRAEFMRMTESDYGETPRA